MTGAAASPAFVLVLGGDGGSLLGVDIDPSSVAGATVVVADSGLHLAHALGLPVHHVVGDLDSAAPGAVAEAERAGATIHRHHADKDATDSELALDLVRELADRPDTGAAPPELLVLGGGGGRLDHLLADLLLLASPRSAGLSVTARIGSATISVVRPGSPRSLVGRPGEQVSLLPLHGGARGVSTTGLRWALVDADLVPGTTRAVSNELVDREASVAIASGVLVVVLPGTTSAVAEARSTPYDPTPVDPDR